MKGLNMSKAIVDYKGESVQKSATALGEYLGYKDGQALMQQFAMVAPAVMTPERMVRVALTAFTRTPKLKTCSKESLFLSLMDLTALGLEPDGRHAHLIPYGDACKVIIDYKGLIALAMRSGKVSKIHAELVCTNDDFEYDMCMVRRHKIDFKRDRGAVYGVYSYVQMKDGTEDYEFMTEDEVETIRKRSPSGNSDAWKNNRGEMSKKTCIRRHSKRWDFAPEVQDALEKDMDSYANARPVDVEQVDATVGGEGTAPGAVNAADLMKPEKPAQPKVEKHQKQAEPKPPTTPPPPAAMAVPPKAEKPVDTTSALIAIADTAYENYLKAREKAGITNAPAKKPDLTKQDAAQIESTIKSIMEQTEAIEAMTKAGDLF